MRYDFIEIGTSNFDTLAEDLRRARGISVEPLEHLLSQVKVDPSNNVIKVCAALCEKSGHDFIWEVTEGDIEKYDLPSWVLSSSAIGKLNPNVERVFKEKDLCHSIIKQTKVKTISWKTLFDDYTVSSVDEVKIDAEGMDCKIVGWLLDFLEKSKIALPRRLKFEARQEMTNKALLKETIARLRGLGYKTLREGNDIVCAK